MRTGGRLERSLAAVTGPESALARPGARVRWSALLAAVLVLCLAPAVISALPVSAPTLTIAQLVGRARASADVPFTGYAVARGSLALPDVSALPNDVTALLSDTTRLRAWYDSSSKFRVDRISYGGEDDTYVDGPISTVWDSGNRSATRSTTSPQLPLPSPPDALPSSLGRKLLAEVPAGAAGVEISGNRRIAGRAATELVWQPNDPRSLVGRVRVWVDTATGLPLRVELRPVGQQLTVYTTEFLDLSLARPAGKLLTFDPAGDPVDDTVAAESGDLRPQVRLPDSLVGLPKRSEARPLVATYGGGLELVAVAPMDDTTAMTIRNQIDSPSHLPVTGAFGEGSAIEAPMLQALVFASGNRGYVLAGTVPRFVLEEIAVQLERNRPRRIS